MRQPEAIVSNNKTFSLNRCIISCAPRDSARCLPTEKFNFSLKSIIEAASEWVFSGTGVKLKKKAKRDKEHSRCQKPGLC